MQVYQAWCLRNTSLSQQTAYVIGKGEQVLGTVSEADKADCSWSDLKDFIQQMRSFTQVVPVWSSFTNRNGHLIEKCVFEWTPAEGVRNTEVIWINKGYERYVR